MKTRVTKGPNGQRLCLVVHCMREVQSRPERERGEHMEWMDLIQWPAMAATVVSAWMVASERKWKRNEGFWLFLISNVLWLIWAIHDQAYALVFLQLCLAGLNIRGIRKNRAAH